MKLPQKLLDEYHITRPRQKVSEPSQPAYRTFPAMLTFDDGEKLHIELTARNKPYWAGQMESEIMNSWNSNPAHQHKVVRVKVFRNSRCDSFINKATTHGADLSHFEPTVIPIKLTQQLCQQESSTKTEQESSTSRKATP